MNLSPIVVIIGATGGLLLWSAIKNQNPVNIIKGALGQPVEKQINRGLEGQGPGGKNFTTPDV